MVNMIGFHHKEPTYNTATEGEPGFYIHVKPRPTSEHPLRARVTTPCGWATWKSPEEAQLWADHPGGFPVMVRAYLEWAGSSTSPQPASDDEPTAEPPEQGDLLALLKADP